MSVLYPRLLDRAARALHTEYSQLPIRELQERAATHHRSAVFAATGGRRVSETELKDLRSEILRRAEHAGFPAEGRRQDRATFDLETARLLHERSGLVAAEASVRAAWAFLALVLVPDIAYWRYPRPPADRVLGTDITRHVLGRLWWRAHLLEDPTTPGDRYALIESFGEAAFDQIFARRRSIGGSRVLVRTLACTWPRQHLAGLNEREVLTEVLKRLLRLGAVIDFESLDEADLAAQVHETMAEAIAAKTEEAGTCRQ
jgi:hypothetical protein